MHTVHLIVIVRDKHRSVRLNKINVLPISLNIKICLIERNEDRKWENSGLSFDDVLQFHSIHDFGPFDICESISAI